MTTAANFTTLDMCAIAPSRTNPRLSMDPVALDGLCESIKAVGLQNPIIVRPDCDGYEIVAGHRRYAAYEKLGREEIPAIVREMTDEECREAQLVDNLQRADLDPLEECAAYASLRQWLGTPAAIAQRVGKSVAHVTRVLQLEKLTAESRAALAQRVVGFDHALLLAKLAAAEQDKTLRWALFGPFSRASESTADLVAKAAKQQREGGAYAYYEPKSVLEVKGFVEHEIRLDLKRAPWPLDDAEMSPLAGACTGCPKNTAANEALFGDLAIESARCMDSGCFEAKRERYVQIQMEAVQAAGAGAVRISWKATNAAPRMDKAERPQPKPDQVFKRGQSVEAKKGSCPHVATGVAVDYGDGYGRQSEKQLPGTKLTVCVAAGCKAHPKEWEKPKAEPGSRGGGDRVTEQARRVKKAEECKAENALRLKLANEALSKLKRLPEAAVRDAFLELSPWDLEDRCAAWAKALKSSPVDSSEFAEAATAVWLDTSGLQVDDSGWADASDGRKRFQAALKLLGYDASRAWDKPSPNPKPAKEVAEKKSQSGRKGAANQPRPAAKKAPAKKAAAKPKPVKKGARK